MRLLILAVAVAVVCASTLVHGLCSDEIRNDVVTLATSFDGATEPDAKFMDLFPNIEKTRAAVKGYTTCVDFVTIMFQRVKNKPKKQPNVYFFDKGNRHKFNLPPTAYHQLTPTETDTTCIITSLSATPPDRPLPGDVIQLQFIDGPMKGYFSHPLPLLAPLLVPLLVLIPMPPPPLKMMAPLPLPLLKMVPLLPLPLLKMMAPLLLPLPLPLLKMMVPLLLPLPPPLLKMMAPLPLPLLLPLPPLPKTILLRETTNPHSNKRPTT